MQPLGSTLDGDWAEALTRAARRLEEEDPASGVFLEDRTDRSARVDPGCSDVIQSASRIRGLAVSGRSDDRHLFLGDPAPEDAERLAGLEPGAPFPGPSGSPGGPEPSPEADDNGPSAAELLRRGLDRFHQLCKGAWIDLRWVEFEQEIAVARPGGALARDRRYGRRVRIEVSAPGGNVPVMAVEELTGGRPDGAAIEAGVERAVERLDQRRKARPAPSGPQSMAFAAGVGGILVHEIVGHALEARPGKASVSWLDTADGPVARPEVSIVDDPRRGRAPWRVDDQGEMARPVSLIRGGLARGRLDDCSTAAASGRSPSGHGRRASFRDPVLPRMGCTFIAAGRFDPAEVLDGIERGIFVRRMEAARTDPRTGIAIFRVTDSDLIDQGSIGAPLQPHLIRVEGPGVLANVDRVGNDLRFDVCTGSCVRDGQALAIGVGAPTIRTGLITAISG